MFIGELLELHSDLRRYCYDLARRNNGELMGDYAWLCYALGEPDITISASEEGINCTGFTHTVQTMDTEWFDFIIPWERIPDEFKGELA